MTTPVTTTRVTITQVTSTADPSGSSVGGPISPARSRSGPPWYTVGHMELRLHARTSAVRDVRRQVTLWAQRNGAHADAQRTLTLLTSEIVTNAVEHGPADGSITVRAQRQANGFWVAVTDEAVDRPVVQPFEIGRSRGRGLQLVELLSADWGVDVDGGQGKSVWFVVSQ